MTKRASKMETLFYKEPFYRELINNLDISVYVFDEQGRYVFLNKTAESMEGIKNEDVKGMHIREIYTHPNYSPSLKALETGKHVVDNDNIYMLNGKRFRQVVNAYPIIEDNEIIGVYTIQRDITSLEQMVVENLNFQRRTRCAERKVEFESLIGEDPEFMGCISMAASAAEHDLTVLISGATGTGKEVFAKGIHNASKRKGGPFVAINCGAIPETLLESILFGTEKGAFTGAVDKKGIFEQAKGGTVFLDELNSMPFNSQVKLLRVLEEQEIRHVGGNKDIKTDVRVISAMNVTPQEALYNNNIREDLFYRLSVINISIPPLCKRGNDIFLLTDHFIEKYNTKFDKQIKGIDAKAHTFLLEYKWPGNVRQLKHAVESAVSMTEENAEYITINDLPQYLFGSEYIKSEVRKASSDRSFIRDVSEGNKIQADDRRNEKKTDTEVDVFDAIRNKERDIIVKALFEHNGNVTKTAKALNMHRQSLIYKMKKYEIKRSK